MSLEDMAFGSKVLGTGSGGNAQGQMCRLNTGRFTYISALFVCKVRLSPRALSQPSVNYPQDGNDADQPLSRSARGAYGIQKLIIKPLRPTIRGCGFTKFAASLAPLSLALLVNRIVTGLSSSFFHASITKASTSGHFSRHNAIILYSTHPKAGLEGSVRTEYRNHLHSREDLPAKIKLGYKISEPIAVYNPAPIYLRPRCVHRMKPPLVISRDILGLGSRGLSREDRIEAIEYNLPCGPLELLKLLGNDVFFISLNH
ncbi:unnamed protein product [Fusarium venenatum]|uniref:Uncharacterized protein n=1 Tax=Fusarium venenatum TaxID=56646 RepID=A0A2L2TUH0_9HYPO|nr:uncharacterized protein FVRRES_10288 [Fusarium venenatum]CEI70211.1 unnamed protein product [Fusarium venenatum]